MHLHLIVMGCQVQNHYQAKLELDYQLASRFRRLSLVDTTKLQPRLEREIKL